MIKKDNNTIEESTIFNNKASSFVITASIFMMALLSLYVERKNYYDKGFHQYMLVCLIATTIIAVAIIFFKPKVKKAYSDRFAILCWATFSLYTLASDILVDKQYRFAGILIYMTLLLLGWNWNKTHEKWWYIRDFERAIQLFLLILIVASLFFQVQSREEGRFSGPIENPSVFALYLCSIWAVLLGIIEHQIRNKENKYIIFLTITEMLASLLLLFLAQSLTPMIALVAVTILWLFRMIRLSKGTRFAIILLIVVGILSIAGVIGLVLFTRQIGYEGNSRILQKLQSDDITSFLSKRDYYWRRYLREMNLFGHGKKPFLWDHRILPHNALIGMMYWYGVPCVIPYIIMMMMGVEKSFRFADTSVPYAAVPFYSIVSFVIMSMADNVEQPFVWLPWIACYLMMAAILVMRVEDIEALKVDNREGNEEEKALGGQSGGKHDIKAEA